MKLGFIFSQICFVSFIGIQRFLVTSYAVFFVTHSLNQLCSDLHISNRHYLDRIWNTADHLIKSSQPETV